jgi:hypothetical protein
MPGCQTREENAAELMRDSEAVYATFSIDLRIWDAGLLWQAARERFLKDGNGTEQGFEELCGTKGEPDIEGCLVTILDPGTGPSGTEIDQSYAIAMHLP